MKNRISDGSSRNDIDARNDYTIRMLENSMTLNLLDNFVVINRWERLIGFSMIKVIQENFSAKNPNKTLPKYHEFAKCSYYARDGSPFDSLELPKQKNVKGEFLPYGAIIDV